MSPLGALRTSSEASVLARATDLQPEILQPGAGRPPERDLGRAGHQQDRHDGREHGQPAGQAHRHQAGSTARRRARLAHSVAAEQPDADQQHGQHLHRLEREPGRDRRARARARPPESEHHRALHHAHVARGEPEDPARRWPGPARAPRGPGVTFAPVATMDQWYVAHCSPQEPTLRATGAASCAVVQPAPPAHRAPGRSQGPSGAAPARPPSAARRAAEKAPAVPRRHARRHAEQEDAERRRLHQAAGHDRAHRPCRRPRRPSMPSRCMRPPHRSWRRRSS